MLNFAADLRSGNDPLDPGQLDRAFRRCRQHRLFDEAWELYKSVSSGEGARSLAAVADLMLFNAALAAVVGVGGKAGYERAVEVKRDLLAAGMEPDLHTMTMMVDASRTLAQAKEEFQDAQERQLAVDAHLVTAVLKACGRARRADAAQEVYDAAPALGVKRNAHMLSALLHAYSQPPETDLCSNKDEQDEGRSVRNRDHVALAVAAFEAALSEHPEAVDRVTWNTLIGVCARAGDVARAEALTQRGRELGLEQDPVTVNSLIGAYAGVKRWDLVRGALEDPSAHPNTSSFSTAISAMSKAGQIGLAAEVWRLSVRRSNAAHSALKVALRSKNSPVGATLQAYQSCIHEGLPTSARMYDNIIGVCTQTRRGKKSMLFFQQALEKGYKLQLVTIKKLLLLCGKDGRVEDSFVVHSGSRAMGIPPDPVTLTIVISTCARRGKAERAMEVYEEARALGMSVDRVMVNAMVNVCAQSGQADMAIGVVADAIQNQVPLDSFTISSFVSAFARKNQVEEALVAFEMGKWLGVPTTTVVLNAVINACAKAGKKDLALETYHQAISEGAVPDSVTFNSLIHACARAKDPTAACEIFMEAVALGVHPDEFTICSLIDACAQAGDAKHALEVYRLASTMSVQPTNIMVNSVVNAAARAGEPEIAMEVFTEAKMLGVGMDKTTMSFFVRAFIAAGQPDQALVVMQMGDWMKVPCSAQVRAELLEACKRANIEDSYHSAVYSSKSTGNEQFADNALPATSAP